MFSKDLVNIACPKVGDLSKVKKGDMPSDVIKINEGHIFKAEKIFHCLKRIIEQQMHEDKMIISVYGGSGVGKSEIGSLLAYYFSALGIGSYVLSGDNYPYRIPIKNDAYRMKIYEELGKKGLENYLGSTDEIDFPAINKVLEAFKKGQNILRLKRMGRTEGSIYYESIDMSDVRILILEWTHGNNSNLKHIDIPIYLNSTPEETLAHRKNRNRDGETDSLFTMMVLAIEQNLLSRQMSQAKIIVEKNGEIITSTTRLAPDIKSVRYGPMLNAYPDSVGGSLEKMIRFLEHPSLKEVFDAFYILPSIFHSDLDRGFSVIDYELNESYAKQEDLDRLKSMDIAIKLDFVLNHKSVLSKEFQDILQKGTDSEYMDYFIHWNAFWKDCGVITEAGYLVPDDKYIAEMFFRKQGLPLLQVIMPDGSKVPFWNTFYQEVIYEPVTAGDISLVLDLPEGKVIQLAAKIQSALQAGILPETLNFGEFNQERKSLIKLIQGKTNYLGQMDLNINSHLVWQFYEETIEKLASYGAKIIRLDAFAYAAKAVGKKNFFNEPETWELLTKLNEMAQRLHIALLPEIHSKYEEKVHERIADKGYMIYDFFLPGLMIDAFERKTFQVLSGWIDEIILKDLKTVNMLGCHDGIPLLDLKGLLSDELIQKLIDTVVSRGGLIKDLHGKKNMYYQVNATYFSALGEDETRMILARAIQMFMPGIPQVWYLDLFAGTNDYEAVKQGDGSSHKEINRTNLTVEKVQHSLKKEVVKKQLEFIRFRNNHLAFNPEARISIANPKPTQLTITWVYEKHKAKLEADIETYLYKISAT